MNSRSNIRPIDPETPQGAVIAEAAGCIHTGGVVVFPTRSLYGIGADAFNARAIARVFDLKQRPAAKPILVLIASPADLAPLVQGIPPAGRCLMEHFWPGGLTLVFEAAVGVPSSLTAGTGKIGIRIPLHPVARALVAAVGRPVTATSANISGHTGGTRVADLDPALAGGVDLVLDAGVLPGGRGSTVVDVTTDPIQILREGNVPALQILRWAQKSGRDNLR